MLLPPWRTRIVAVLTLVLGVLVTALTPLAAESTPVLAPAPQRAAIAPVRVLAISVDGLNPQALAVLGRIGTPNFHRLLGGARTLNARTQTESTETLPNHVSMVTGRRVARKPGGHGVTWNTDQRGRTVQGAAGEGVYSIFSSVEEAGGTAAVFGTKTKFSIFKRSWPLGVDALFLREKDDAAAVAALTRDLAAGGRDFAFLHLGGADVTGHKRGFMSKSYLAAVRRIDAHLGRILNLLRYATLRNTVIVLTSDHGGRGTRGHKAAKVRDNYRVPFLVWGPGVTPGDLYAMNPTYADPGRGRPGPQGRQPIRNGDLANLSADLLGLPPVPDSLWDRQQSLRVSR